MTQNLTNQNDEPRHYKEINEGDQTVNTVDGNGELQIEGCGSALLKQKVN